MRMLSYVLPSFLKYKFLFSKTQSYVSMFSVSPFTLLSYYFSSFRAWIILSCVHCRNESGSESYSDMSITESDSVILTYCYNYGQQLQLI